MKRIDIDEKLKPLLGKYISYLRNHEYKSREPLDWQMEDFVVDDEGEAICSVRTLSRIENGQIILNDDIYDRLLKKLEMKFDYTYSIQNVEESLNELHEKRNQLSADVASIFTETKSLINGFEASFPNKLYQSILNFIDYDKTFLPEDALELFLYYIDYLPYWLKNLVRDRIMVHYLNHGLSKSLKEEDIDKVVHLYCENTPNDIFFRSYYYVNQGYYYLSLKEIDQYFDHHDQINVHAIIQLESIKLFILDLIKDKGIVDLLETFDQRLSDHRESLSVESLATHRYNISLYYARIGEYDKALGHIKDVISLKSSLTLRAASLGLILSQKLDKKAEDEFILEMKSATSLEESVLSKIYQYFLMKHQDEPVERLEDYIMADIYHHLKYVSDQATLDFFTDELDQLTSISSNRQKFYKWKQRKFD